ncbi:NADP-dependent isocitrate dehydrogenase [Campylobacter sp. MG1]|uniref:NADP-dependent isocitrate dehydrogenase n=1 Tax=Campylobacter sp. MG1 TaxID=2976332 RepID=UPI00226C72DC|nr:NADP-dependent isocitrate dehydrogenase [Campylobacter sp. MG1]
MSIYYTFTDESPALATFSFLPIAKAFLKYANIDVKVADISLSARILANFGEYLKPEQRVDDALAMLGELVKKDGANVIKTPNISASIPQIKACIKELQEKGYNVPNYPDEPKNDEERKIKDTYAKVLGSAVNPVLRQGNSDRRSTRAVKEYAKANPYKTKAFSKDSKSCVTCMSSDDFFSNEKAFKVTSNSKAIIYKIVNNVKTELKSFDVVKDEIIDATFMNVAKLDEFYDKQIEYCKKENILFSLHLKATMMKVSDPVLFAHALKVYFKDLFAEFSDEFTKLGVNPNNGLKELLAKVENSSKKDEILKRYNEILNTRAPISMVNSDNGITNLHVPSDVIVDASMPAMLKNGAKLWDKNGDEMDTNAVIPDQTYATIYQAVLDDMRVNGAINPSKVGSVSNVGLMAKKAQEYGSHDKTFIADSDATYVVEIDDKVVLSHNVKKGDIYRVNQAKPDAIENWIKLAEQRCADSGEEGIFWLDEKRASNKILADLVRDRLGNKYLILNPYDACKKSLEIIRSGKNCISITGNVLRDYLTDLFPILELGTSAKMLSIVPMLNGGAMFETGAGGSAPKQVEQVMVENHLRWDSLGEFLALQSSLEYEAKKNNPKAKVLAEAFDEAISMYLEENKAPSRKVKENDNRTSHFFFAKYLANSLAKQDADKEIQVKFMEVADKINANSDKIFAEYMQAEGKPVDLGGYYDLGEKADKLMRPSITFNDIIKSI